MKLRLIFAFAFLVGCNKTTPFPPGLDPIDEENKAPMPSAVPGDPYPEQLSMVSGHQHGYDFVQAKGYVHASPAVTWTAVHTAKVDADPKLDGSFTFNVEPQYEYSFKIHYEPSPGVEFEVTWRHQLVDGTEDAPLLTASRFQKTWGTTYISLLEGSVVTRPVIDPMTNMPVDGVTELEIIEHLDATASDSGTLREYFGNFFKNIQKFIASASTPSSSDK